ncbi:pancreatic triacylglycerol lipase [Frankliniella occidentalis]|uniref:Pancreatic triacylglycerol lipase n=1 Tax=Frankliniella occidentalis TaxID=133901 RepID=A0A6J1T1U5_FRAOC|nr:pancreatic triacylglycerol lipase [Frankliniella occidentalis]XP_026287534.2 pancreatic triacylglycerol lipase [Frankliniella occidentalis]
MAIRMAATLILLCTALLSVGGESLVEEITAPVVGDAIDGVADNIADGVVDVATNITSAVTDGFKEVKLVLIASDKNATFDLEKATSVLSDTAFNSALPTVVYMHGYSENRDSESVQVMSDAFLRKGSHNFVFVDWSLYASPPYVSAFLHLPGVSAVVGDTVNDLVQAGLSRDGLWLIGHSMGGQMAAIVSRNLDFKPKRISALDPALPGYQIPNFPNLTRDDAVLVDVIHTDAGVYGYNKPCGHVDFFPNSGRRLQPGCPRLPLLDDKDFCSHHRSWEFFAESVANEIAFPAVKCSSWDDFEDGSCPVNGTNIAYLGYKLPTQVEEGDYYLRTNDASPFAQGLKGVTVEVEETNGIAEFLGGIASKTQSFFVRVFPIF